MTDQSNFWHNYRAFKAAAVGKSKEDRKKLRDAIRGGPLGIITTMVSIAFDNKQWATGGEFKMNHPVKPAYLHKAEAFERAG